ncbi:DNA-binding NarL/FixJ family response regulator [Thermocatellispora tengchongensis]|uniref:DNA-binding NarL/FixJ family response regulator n=1 Tax=Thermocatellispora tengchongensis TaxID=1073253 RepID=A0A840PMP0_9ACTN|nr:response regulator transcription factor [Thermocatellispora tengchongensis]MBB5140209.1 DNA-binding NarL/FixJ family response regulator [Thermocatellispora tengchongensis]
MTIRVIVADDQAPTREGLRLLLSSEPGIEVVATAGDGYEVVAMARRHRPEVVLTDIRMPRMDGLAAIRDLLALDPAPAVVALTTFNLDEYLFGALQAGAVGFLLKESDPGLIIDAVRVAHDGQGLVDPRVTPRLLHRFAVTSPRPPTSELASLTPRETDVLRHLATGASNAEIAQALVISPGTVKVHIERILAKLGLRTRVQAAVYAHRHGLVTWADLP